MKIPNYYDILGIPRNATQEQIKSAYRKKMKNIHPDVNPNLKEATRLTEMINNAYKVLSNPSQRASYDSELSKQSSKNHSYTYSNSNKAMDTSLTERDDIRNKSSFKKIIRWSFYILAFLTPLLFFSFTTELFEWNKMMFVYLFTIIITTTWILEMIQSRTLLIKRTPLDIPLMLFLFSQILSTIFSTDVHTSIFGYYSRLNGGLLSTISYTLLFYALVAHFKKDDLKNFIRSAIYGGLVVALWAIPEHFGYSLSCLVLTGHLNDACWVQDVQSRVFATLGQPNWLAAYLAMLIFLSLNIVFTSKELSSKVRFAVITLMYYFAFTFTYSRGATFGLIGGIIVYITLFLLPKELIQIRKFTAVKFALINLVISLGVSAPTFVQSKFFVFTSLLQSMQISSPLITQLTLALFFFIILTILELNFIQIRKIGQTISYNSVGKWLALIIGCFLITNLLFNSALVRFQLFHAPQKSSTVVSTQSGGGSQLETGGTESGAIRLIVWRGAFSILKAYPIFGSGVETFAYAYYQYRPVAHNLTSEWDFLYNKAHNEFINYLATTGIVGFTTYMAIIITFMFWTIKRIISLKMKKGDQNEEILFLAAILGSYISYLIQNFFGFSVVIVALFFFLFPGLSFIESETITPLKLPRVTNTLSKYLYKRTITVYIAEIIILVIGIFFFFSLTKIYFADTFYKQGSDYSDAGDAGQAYLALSRAVSLNSGEPLYHSDLGYASAATALALASDPSADAKTKQDDQATVQALTTQALDETTLALTSSPNNTSFWRTAIRTYVQLALLNKQFEPITLTTVDRAISLAPTDPALPYNKALIIEQFKQLDEPSASDQKVVQDSSNQTIPLLLKAISLKPDYHEALFKLGTVYNTLDKKEQALQEFKTILHYIPNDPDAKQEVASLSAQLKTQPQ